MADLSGGDRGQIILVAAFALAIIFVALALIVNSAIFTENLASRGETTGSGDALSMRAMVETNVGDAVRSANRHDNSSTATLTAAVNAGISNISKQTGRQGARSGRVVDVAYDSSRAGKRLYQSNGTTFANDSSDAYPVAEDVTRVAGGNGTRAFELDATGIAASDNASAFTVRVQEHGLDSGNENSWRARIWRVDADTVHVRTLKNESGTRTTEDCEVTHDPTVSSVHIDVTGGTIQGEECDALTTGPTGENFHFAAGATDNYDISFANAGNITGNFSMVVHPGAGLALPSLDTTLQSSDALYDVTVRYTYVTTDLRYETDVRVAPGETDV
ncbi:DUF7261 family protein [Haloarcula laminariae]|uniref:DUF7261 family protein n=1 Tax=Haloarcula laminariae TaxID=2961577 RepID=UPI0021C58DAA|nr:hypothetical protein [Halomicroarcula laminariae]